MRIVYFIPGKIVIEGWAAWSECSSTCQPGVRSRKRNCRDTGRPGPDQCTIPEVK